MSLFTWESKYDIGVTSMNEEHKKLIDLMNQLYTQNSENADKATQARTLSRLADFTKTHFQHEENYMASIHYPELKTHQLIHGDLLKKLAEHKAEFEKAGGTLTPGFFAFLRRWLGAHILGIDAKYGKAAAAHPHP